MPLQKTDVLQTAVNLVIQRPSVDLSSLENLVANPFVKPTTTLSALMQQESQSFDLTLPGFSYMGPGTRTVANILNGIKPINNTDELAMYHDLAYAKDPSPTGQLAADALTIKKALTTPLSSMGDLFSRALMIQGLSLKTALTANPIAYLVNKMVSSNEPTLEEKRMISVLENHAKSLGSQQPKVESIKDLTKGADLIWTQDPSDDPTQNLLKFRNRYGSIGM